jgi:hypothetical protein
VQGYQWECWWEGWRIRGSARRGKGFGSRNLEGEVLLEFVDTMGMVIVNTWFDKEEAQKVSYESGESIGVCRSVVDYVLVRKEEHANVVDVN